jgi:hypothetical protein
MVFKSASERVFEEEFPEGLSEAESALVGLYHNYLINTTPGWRPSDAMRRACRTYKSRPDYVRSVVIGAAGQGWKS